MVFARDRFHFKQASKETPTSKWVCLFGRGRYTVGHRRKNDFAYDVKLLPQFAANPKDAPRMMENLAQVLIPFNIDPDRRMLKPYFNLSPSSKGFADDLRKRLSSAETRIIIGINISGSKPAKFWGVDRFIDFILALKQLEPQANIVVLYSKPYTSEAGQIAQRTGVTLSEETPTLSDFAAAISQLNVLVTPDSAAVHFADIFNVPALILMRDPSHIVDWNPVVTRFEAVHARDMRLDTISTAEALDGYRRLSADIRHDQIIKHG